MKKKKGSGHSIPTDSPWVHLPKTLLMSDAWRSAGINTRRVLDYLIIEHLRKGGKNNGQLKAPHRQLMQFGVGARFAASAISEAEELGLIDCIRGGMRVATTYGLTWLPLHNGNAASNRWRTFRNPDLQPVPEPKFRNLPNKGEAGLPNKGEADDHYLPNKGEADMPKNLPNKGEALSRISYQGSDSIKDSIGGAGIGRVVALPVGSRR